MDFTCLYNGACHSDRKLAMLEYRAMKLCEGEKMEQRIYKRINWVIIMAAAVALTGCSILSPIKLEPKASMIEISKNKPKEKCRYIAPIEAVDSWLFRDMFTSNDNQVQSAYSLLRNRAQTLNANYVQVLHYEYRQSSLLGIFEFTRMPALSAVAYRCSQ